MVDRDSLKAQIDAELSKYEEADSSKTEPTEIKSESSVDEDTSELVAEETVAENATIETEETKEDPYLKEAIEMGYDPNYKGPNRKSPEQFVRDGSFFKKIDAQKKEIQELKAMMKQQLEHTRKVEKAAAERKLAEANQEKLEKIAEGDVEGYRLAEQKEQAASELLKQTQELEVQQPTQQPLSDELKGFIKRNETWCNFDTPENRNMAEDADLIASRTAARFPGKAEKEILEMVEDTIKKLYPHRFENPNTKKMITVAKSTTSSDSVKSSLAGKLTARQRQFAEMAKKVDPTFSLEQYAKELKLTGELRDE